MCWDGQMVLWDAGLILVAGEGDFHAPYQHVEFSSSNLFAKLNEKIVNFGVHKKPKETASKLWYEAYNDSGDH